MYLKVSGMAQASALLLPQINEKGCIRKGVRCKILPEVIMQITKNEISTKLQSSSVLLANRLPMETVLLLAESKERRREQWGVLQGSKREGKECGGKRNINMGTMTGEGWEQADTIERKKVDMVCSGNPVEGKQGQQHNNIQAVIRCRMWEESCSMGDLEERAIEKFCGPEAGIWSDDIEWFRFLHKLMT